MAANKKVRGGGAIATGGTNLYQAGTNVSAEFQEINICNTTSGNLTVRLHVVASGGSAATTNALLYDLPVPANRTEQWTGKIPMTAGDYIYGVGSGSGLTGILTVEETRL